MSAFGMHLTPSARRQLLAACWLVVLTGLLWIVLGWGMDPEDYMNPLRIWRHRLLVTHGISVYALLWVVGQLFALHQQGNWRAQRNRMSGMVLSVALLLLAASGLTLYYPPSEDWRDGFSLLHQILGCSVAVLLPLHAWLGRKGRRERIAASHANVSLDVRS